MSGATTYRAGTCHAGVEAWEGLRDWATATAGLALTADQIDRLARYLDVLLLWNRRISLVSQRAPAEIIAKHVADSLFVASCCAEGEPVIDLGSGAGFPGLPIAVARPGARVCVVESRGKKASFLEEARRVASIPNALICHRRIESMALDSAHRGRYTVATARALTNPVAFFRLARPFLAAGGWAIAMCSIGQAGAPELPDAEEIRYLLPDRIPRRLLIVRT